LGDDPRWSLGDGTDGFSVLADGLGVGVSVERGDELGHLLVALPTWAQLVRAADRVESGLEVVGHGSAAVMVWLPAWIWLVR
jgi:hypothetical protein